MLLDRLHGLGERVIRTGLQICQVSTFTPLGCDEDAAPGACRRAPPPSRDGIHQSAAAARWGPGARRSRGDPATSSVSGMLPRVASLPPLEQLRQPPSASHDRAKFVIRGLPWRATPDARGRRGTSPRRSAYVASSPGRAPGTCRDPQHQLLESTTSANLRPSAARRSRPPSDCRRLRRDDLDTAPAADRVVGVEREAQRVDLAVAGGAVRVALVASSFMRSVAFGDLAGVGSIGGTLAGAAAACGRESTRSPRRRGGGRWRVPSEVRLRIDAWGQESAAMRLGAPGDAAEFVAGNAESRSARRASR